MTSSSTTKVGESWTRNAYFRGAINFSKNLVDRIDEEVKRADEELLRRGAEYERVSHNFEKQLALRLRRQTIQSADVIEARHAYQAEEDTKRKQDLAEIREVYPLSSLEDDAEHHLRTILRSKLLSHLKKLEEMGHFDRTLSSENHFCTLKDQKGEDGSVRENDVSTPPRYANVVSTTASQGAAIPLRATVKREVYFVPQKEVERHQSKKEVPGSPFSAQALLDVQPSNQITSSSCRTTGSTRNAIGYSSVPFRNTSQLLPSLSALPIAEFEASVQDRSFKRREEFFKDRLQLFRTRKKEFGEKKIFIRNFSVTCTSDQDGVRSSIEARSRNDDELLPYAKKHVEESIKKIKQIQRERKKRAKKAQELIGQLQSVVNNDSRTDTNHKNDAGQQSFLPHSPGEENLIRSVIRQAMRVDFSAREGNHCNSVHQTPVSEKKNFPVSSSLFADKYFQSFSLPTELSVAQREEVQRYAWPLELENRISHCLCATVDQSIADLKWRPVLLSTVDADALLASAVEHVPYCQWMTGRSQKVCVPAVTPLQEIFRSTNAVNLPSALPLAEISSYGASPRRPILPAVGCKVWFHVKGRGESVFSTAHFKGCEI